MMGKHFWFIQGLGSGFMAAADLPIWFLTARKHFRGSVRKSLQHNAAVSWRALTIVSDGQSLKHPGLLPQIAGETNMGCDYEQSQTCPGVELPAGDHPSRVAGSKTLQRRIPCCATAAQDNQALCKYAVRHQVP